MQIKIVTLYLIYLLFPLFWGSCDDETLQANNDPVNLKVVVTAVNGNVTIVASAENTVEYQFLLGIQEELIEKNSTGAFSYTFNQSGTYTIQIRAYGLSGRYLKEFKYVTVILENDTVDPENGYTTPLTYSGYDLVWNDEFTAGALNETDWTFELGDGCPNCGWGNNELQYYRKENTTVEGGILTIEAREESFGSKAYTSSRIVTKGKQEFKYGRIDIRALLPEGQGIWPALWTLGSNISSVNWPSCGEIDIMEMIGGEGRDNTVHGTVHYDNAGHVYHGDDYKLTNGIFADEYHVFSIIWDAQEISWYVDDNQFYTVDITPAYMSEFHQKFFFIFNVAVGGNWPGNPDETTTFPQQLKVDYIRVFQKK